MARARSRLGVVANFVRVLAICVLWLFAKVAVYATRLRFKSSGVFCKLSLRYKSSGM